ncbi:MAG: hypothetical protein OXL95_09530 [Nitrospira sp.]|nr:hypothetical protein [Nitrospira sp.]MDE0485867.1 hypothetical protein [Nitrospira sp.]
MAILRIDIERALDELISQEEWLRFQRLAVILGRQRWPKLIAHQPKKDFGLDAYVPGSETPEKVGKGLAASITATQEKVFGDAKKAKENFPDLKTLLFVTPAIVGNSKRRKWGEAIKRDYDLELLIIEREDVISLMMMPENARLYKNFLHLNIDVEPEVAVLIDRTRHAADAVTQAWARKTKGHPLIDLTAVQLDLNGAESADVLSLAQIDQALSQSGRIVLEGPAGRGKTTTLIQLAQRACNASTPLIVGLPLWIRSRQSILEYIACMPVFQAEGLTSADLARVQQTEPFLFLLNGWNEITESSSVQANDALRELERDFPSAGILVATRTHHLTPPLPGALRLRLLPLGRGQRAAYLADRLGANGADLRALVETDPSLDGLTRTPFILSEVASLFEAGTEIPSTKFGVLAQVLRLHEQRDEHRNSLQAAPIFGQQMAYLKALANKMTRLGAVALSEADARAVVTAVAGELVDRGQIERAGAPEVIATLTAHHVLERIEYPETVFQFDHQQLQEYCAALDVRAPLLDLRDDDCDAIDRFTADYVNDSAWAEPLLMIAETLAEQTANAGTDRRNIHAGKKLVDMALMVDLVFAGELAQLCGPTVWNEVRAAVGERFRATHALPDGNYQQYAIAAMLASGADDFHDIILPLLSGQDRQTRLRTYRLWPDIQLSSLGSNWREHVRGWNEEARADFVSELLYHRVDGEIASFAVEDNSVAVKKAAVSGLMWTGSDDALTRVLESMDARTFEEVARKNPDDMPPALRPSAIAAMWRFIERTTDHPARLRTALHLIELGEPGLDDVLKDAIAALTGGDMQNLDSHYILPALKYLHKSDPAWTSEWVVTQIAEGVHYGYEEWLPFATVIPDDLVETYLYRLETEDLKPSHLEGMLALIATRADAGLATRLFKKIRELRCRVDADPSQQHKFEWRVMRQLKAVFHRLPGDLAAAGVLSSVKVGDPLDIKVAVDLFSRVARSDLEPLRVGDDDLKARLRTYLKSSVKLVLCQDDFNGEEKANLASSIAQVGKPEDMVDLVQLIRADIERMHRGRDARAAGDRGPRANGGIMSYAGWHIAAVMHLDPASAERVLIDLLPEPEYFSDVAVAMACDFLPKSERSFVRNLRYDLMWAARDDRSPPPDDDQRRTRFVAALNAEIKRLREQNQDGKPDARPKACATALATIDGRGSAAAVLDVIAIPAQCEYICLDAAERLLMAGVILPTTTTFALVDSIFERTDERMQDSDRYLLPRVLALCPFVDDPAAGIAKMRDVLRKRRFWGYELRELITALGESRSDAAIDLLYELASDAQTFEQCADNVINAVAMLDTPRARELLLSFVDPDIRTIALTHRSHRMDVVIARLGELAQRKPETAGRLQKLCERDLPEINRHVLSKVMGWFGTPEALIANLNLIDDAKPSAIPRGVWDQLKSAFVERQPYGQNSNTFTLHARASNELRARLFRMALEDSKRRKSAFMLLGQIEVWRLEHGRPTDEPRHPNLASGQSWPPMEF